MPLLVQDGSDEIRDNHEQQQKQQQQQKEESSDACTVSNPSPPRNEQDRFEESPPLRRSGRQNQLPTIYRDHALITSMFMLLNPQIIKKKVNMMNIGQPWKRNMS